MKKFTLFILFLAVLMITSNVFAIRIGSNYINPSTTLPHAQNSYNAFTVDQIADGVISDTRPYNGFGTWNISSGIITLDLVGVFNLNSFLLWNDINVDKEGINEFRLDFYNDSNSLINTAFSSTYAAPLGQLEEEIYLFDELILGVSRVDIVVLNCHSETYNQIEIREVAFEGELVPATAPVPEPSTAFLFFIGISGFIWFKQKKLKVKNNSPL